MARIRKRLSSYSLKFNGTSTSVLVPVDPATTGFSCGFWLFLTKMTNNDRVLDYQAGGPSGGFTLIVSSSTRALNFVVNNAGSEQARLVCPITMGQWTHIVCTYTSNSAKIYKNATLLATDTSVTMSDPNVDFYIGKRATGATNFAGMRVDNFVLKNGTPWTQTEIDSWYYDGTIPSSYNIYYTMDGNVTDSSTNGNNGTLANGAYEAGVMPFKDNSSKNWSDYALNFSNVTTKNVVIADTALLLPETTNKFTWSARFYLYNTRENVLPRIIEKGANYLCFMGDQTNAQCNRLALEVVGTDSVATEYWASTRIVAHRWYHVVVTFDDATAKIYLDGEPEYMSTIGGPYVSPLASTVGSNLLIGNTSGNSRNFPGLISDVEYHNVDFTAAEAKVLFNNSVTRGLIGKWNIDEGTGGTVADSSGNGNDGTITDAIWQDSSESRQSATGRAIATGRSSV